MARSVRQPVHAVDPLVPSFVWSYEVVIPPDAMVHPLDELDFGYFTSLTHPIGADRAIREIQIHNPTNQLPGGVSVFIGSGQTIPLFATEELLPGEREQFSVDKLGAIGLANYNVDPVLVIITLVALNL